GVVTKKGVGLVAVPAGGVTETLPVAAAAGTCALICVGAVTANMGSVTPLNFTVTAPLKLTPLMMTPTPGAPTPGEKSSMIGAGTTTVKALGVLAFTAAART